MHILISNDDGIFAPGIRALAMAARDSGHRVTIFAPDSQRSAAGHAITITRPLHIHRIDFDGLDAFSVDGTPADCVRLGLYVMRDDLPNYVLTGINNGANRGAATIYSGTVAAAMEGSLCGFPALAVSLCSELDRDYETAAQLGMQALKWTLQNPLPRGEIYSLNVPYGSLVRGIRSAGVSHEYIFEPDYRQMPDGGYQMLRSPDVIPETNEQSDLLLTQAGYASMSILKWNLLSDTPMPDVSGIAPELEAAK